MIEYTVYDRMAPSAAAGHLRLVTRDQTEVDELVGDDTWRYLVTKRVVAGEDSP